MDNGPRRRFPKQDEHRLEGHDLPLHFSKQFFYHTLLTIGSKLIWHTIFLRRTEHISNCRNCLDALFEV